MTDMYELNENLVRLTRQMTNVLRNQDKIIEANERSADSLLQIQKMIFALVVLVIIITLINIGFLIVM